MIELCPICNCVMYELEYHTRVFESICKTDYKLCPKCDVISNGKIFFNYGVNEKK